jgi:hypothetical protein
MTFFGKVTLATILAMLGTGSAHAASYTFLQAGFTSGESVTGSFDAVEIVADGQFRLADGEITQFQATLTKDTGSTVFTMSQSGLTDFVWTFSSGNLLGDQALETIVWSEGLFLYRTGQGVFSCNGIGDCGSYNVGPANSETPNLVEVSRAAPVPLPASGALLACGAGVLALARRRTRRSR